MARRLPLGPLVVGSMLPDLLARAAPLALQRLAARGVPVPPGLPAAFMPLHLPYGMVLCAYLLAQLAPARDRPRAFIAWGLGMGLHLLLDLLQDHQGVGFALLFPWSWKGYELPLYGSEASVMALPVLLPLAALAARSRWRGRAPPERDPGPAD